MTEYTERGTASNLVKGAIICTLLVSSTLPTTRITTQNLLRDGLFENLTSSRCTTMPGEILLYAQAERAMKIRSLRGKYTFVPTSSEKFAQEKRREIEREG